MNVFISWSGELSKKLAETLKSWLPTVIQSIKPYFTPDDLEKGTKWDSEITKKLNECTTGIICLTTENTNSPWILFEAGALSNKLDKSRVCPLLFNLSNSDLTGPLATFQTTVFGKEEFKKLLNTINKNLDENKLTEAVFDEVFDTFFPKLEEKVNAIIAAYRSKRDNPNKSKTRTDREILEEILELTRHQYMKFEIHSAISNKNIEFITQHIIKYMSEKGVDLKDDNEIRKTLEENYKNRKNLEFLNNKFVSGK